jgi:hypothetical protein
VNACNDLVVWLAPCCLYCYGLACCVPTIKIRSSWLVASESLSSHLCPCPSSEDSISKRAKRESIILGLGELPDKIRQVKGCKDCHVAVQLRSSVLSSSPLQPWLYDHFAALKCLPSWLVFSKLCVQNWTSITI